MPTSPGYVHRKTSPTAVRKGPDARKEREEREREKKRPLFPFRYFLVPLARGPSSVCGKGPKRELDCSSLIKRVKVKAKEGL